MVRRVWAIAPDIAAALLIWAYATRQVFLLVHTGVILLAVKALFGAVAGVLFIRRQSAKQQDQSWGATAVAFLHVVCPLLFDTHITVHGTVVLVAATLILFGLGISGFALLDLWDRFGIRPGYRGIERGGLYAFVRHPLYLGYLLAMIGAVFLAPGLRNIMLAAFFIALTVLRMAREERLLAAVSDEYRSYQRNVRYRLLPGVI